MSADPGFFGPDSMMWKVNREVTTLFGGARALMMHAAHPLVAAGARQTGGYRRDPWVRLIRTLQLQNLVTFGSRREAQEAADRINKLHKVINGVDSVTGEWYDALDLDQLLWVHAALEVSTILFYEATIGPLTDAEKDRYHDEYKTSAELILLPADYVPATYKDLEVYVDDIVTCGRLIHTDVAQEVADLIITGQSVPRRLLPLWRFIALAARGTLPQGLMDLYGFRWSPAQQRFLDGNLKMIQKTHTLIPPKFRYILPARWAELRLKHPALV